MIKKTTKILALDTSSKVTGWCVFVNGKYKESGTIDFKKVKDVDERTKKMCLEISRLIMNTKPSEVVVEQLPSTRNAKTARLLSRIIGAVYYHCIKNELSYTEISCATWRRTVGIENKKGEAVKRESIDRVKEIYKKDVKDDEADAINICEAYCIYLMEGKE